MSLDYKLFKEELRRNAYISVPFSLSSVELSKAAEEYMVFLRLPQEIKKEMEGIKINPLDRGSYVGYRRREQQLGDLDEKELFQYNLYFEEFFGSKPEVRYPEVASFLQSAKNIYTQAALMMQEIIDILEGEFPGIYDQFFHKNIPPHFYLRFITYSNFVGGNFLAKGHYDRGGCTLALAESGPGLRIGRTADSLQDIGHHEKEVLFFPGILFPELTSDEFVPAWHDVVQKSEYAVDDAVARWAIVFFADQFEQRVTSFEDNHTPRRG